MKAATLFRLIASGLIAFVSYAAWAYYANSLVTDNSRVLIKAAIVQGTYSGGITLFFTFLLELFYKRFGSSSYCLPLLTPNILSKHTKDNPCSTLETLKATLELSERACKGACLPGVILAPIPALVIQSILVIAVNIAFATPNLWLTVAPSILFSALYGYSYSIALKRKNTKEARKI